MNNKIPIFTVLLLLLLTFAGVAFADTTITLDGTVTGDVYELIATPAYPSGSTVPPNADISFTFPVPVRVAKDYLYPLSPYVDDWRVSIVQDTYDPRVIHLRPQLANEGDQDNFPEAEGKLNWPCGSISLLFNGDEVVAVDQQVYGAWEEYSTKVYNFTVEGDTGPVLIKALPEEGAVLTPKASGATGYKTGVLSYTHDLTKLAFLFNQPVVLLDEKKVTVRTSGPWGVYEGHLTTKQFDSPIYGNSLYRDPRYLLYFDATANPGFYGPAMTGDVTITVQQGAIKTWNGAENDREFVIHYKINLVEPGDTFKTNPPPPQVNEIFSGNAVEAWRVQMNGSYATAPVKGSGHVYIGGDRLRAYTDDGTLAWEIVPAGSKDTYSKPALTNDGIIYTIYHKDGNRDYLQSYNADGTLRFSLPLPGTASNFKLKSNEIVVLCYWHEEGLVDADESEILRVSLEGAVKSAVRIKGIDYVSKNNGVLDFDSESAVIGRQSHGSGGNSPVVVYRVKLPESGVFQDAEILWSYPAGSATIEDVVANGGKIYLVTTEGENRVIKTMDYTGVVLATTQYKHNGNLGGRIDCEHDGIVYMSDSVAVDTGTGSVERLFKSYPHDPVEHLVRVLYVDSNGNRIYSDAGNNLFADAWGNDWEDRIELKGLPVGFCLGSVYVVIGTPVSYDLVKIVPQSQPAPQPQPQPAPTPAPSGGGGGGTPEPKPVKLEVVPEALDLFVGDTGQLEATLYYDDGSTRDVTYDPATAWESDAEGVATAGNGPDGGKVTGITPGKANVSATYNGLSDSAAVTVKIVPPPVPPVKAVSLRVEPPEMTLEVGQTGHYRAIATFSDFSERDVTVESTWAVSNQSVASISCGLVTGLQAGQATVIATWQELSGTAKLIVVQPPQPAPVPHPGKTIKSQPKPVRLEVVPKALDLMVNETGQLKAVLYFNDGSTRNVTHDPATTWKSGAENIATVGNALNGGVVTGVAPGSAMVTATYAGLSDGATVTVRELTGKVFGYVWDKDGNPVAGARVELRSEPRVTFSDSNGYYEFQGVPFGRHTVLIADARLQEIQRIDVILDASGQRIVREGSDRADVQLTRPDREKRVDFVVVPRRPVPEPVPEKPEKKRVFWYPALLLLLLPFIRRSVNVSVEIRRDPGDVKAVVYRDARGPKKVKVAVFINGDKHSSFDLDRNGQHVIGIAPDSYALVEIKTPGRRNVSRKKTATYGGVLDNVLDK